MEFLLLFALLPLILLATSGSDDESEEPDSGRTADDEVLDGSSGADSLFGGAGTDLILGQGQKDEIDGGDGEDILSGGTWADTLSGGAGSDVLLGASGADVLFGGDQSDLLIGGQGDDALYGGADDDDLVGMSGSDTMLGEEGDDWLSGIDVFDRFDPESEATGMAAADADMLLDGLGSAIDDFYGDDTGAAEIAQVRAGFNSFDSDLGDDSLDAGAGDDVVVGDLSDTLTGGLGNDLFTVLDDGFDQAVTITDFNPAEDQLQIYLNLTGDQMVMVADAPDLSGALVQVDGETIAILSGVPAAAVNAGDFLIVQYG